MNNQELIAWLEQEIEEGKQRGDDIDQLIKTLIKLKTNRNLRVFNDWGKNRNTILVAEIEEGASVYLKTKNGNYAGSLCYRQWPNEFYHCGVIFEGGWLPILEGDEIRLI